MIFIYTRFPLLSWSLIKRGAHFPVVLSLHTSCTSWGIFASLFYLTILVSPDFPPQLNCPQTCFLILKWFLKGPIIAHLLPFTDELSDECSRAVLLFPFNRPSWYFFGIHVTHSLNQLHESPSGLEESQHWKHLAGANVFFMARNDSAVYPSGPLFLLDFLFLLILVTWIESSLGTLAFVLKTPQPYLLSSLSCRIYVTGQFRT